MSVPKKGPPAPILTPVFAQLYSTASGTIDSTGGPPRTQTQAEPTASGDSDKKLRECGETFAHFQPTSTPIVQKISMTRLDPLKEEQYRILKKELEPFIELPKTSTFASSLYQDLATIEEIDKFLNSKKTLVYSNERWALPRSDPNLLEDAMYEPLVRLLNAILEWKWKKVKVTRRTAIDTHLKKLPHKEPVPTTNKSSPDISVKAEGSSFQVPHRPTKGGIGYSNITTFVEVKVTNQPWLLTDLVLQVAAYARQIFINQPNRRFVRALIVTEQNFRLLHLDRSGVQFTQPIDIHGDEGSRVFVRLVLGLCSTDGRNVGLDTSIHWDIRNGRKASGTLRMRGPKEETRRRSQTRRAKRPVVTYELASVDPIVSCYNIRGRGVVCWEVIDPQSGETLLVRDVWRSEDRLSEYVYLDRAKGIPGVVEMISCEVRGATKDMRDFGESTHADFRNRVATRIVMDSHGKSIKHFRSPMELLCALRDAIDGHRELYLRKTLHRDIALDNIMLGRPNASTGYRGVLTGLDMAILNRRNVEKNISTDWKTSTGSYQSVIVLKSGQQKDPLAHDHLDDLESFVYVLTHIMYGYDQTGAECTLSNAVQSWDLSENLVEASAKAFYLDQDFAERESEICKRWPPSCINLLLELKIFAHENYKQKARLANEMPHLRKIEVKSLASKVPEHYKTVLALFDEAIEKIESGDDTIPPSPAEPDPNMRSSSYEPGSSSPPRNQDNITSSPYVDFSSPPKPKKRRSATQKSTRVLGKRSSEGQPDGQSPTKRSRLAIEASPGTSTRKSNRVRSRASKYTTPRQRPTGGHRPM